MRAKWFVAMIAIASLAAACGGDDENTDDRSADAPSADSTTDDTSEVTFDLDGPEATFTEVEGLTVRFANVYWTDGAGTPIDIYWGPNPDQGEKVATLAYGEVSDYVTAKVDPNSLDAGDLVVSFIAEGGTETPAVLMSDDETLTAGDQVTYVMGAGDTTIDGHQAGSQQIVLEKSGSGNALDEPAAGQALLFTLDLGLQAIPEPDADFVELGAADGCLPGAFGSMGNAGQAYPVDAGAVSVAAFDVNQECPADANATPFIDLTLAEGDQVLVILYGPTKDDRQAVAAPVQ